MSQLAELENRLLERYKDLPFAILGVCCDDEINDEVLQTAKDHRMTWTSIRDNLPDGQTLSDSLGVDSLPTVILLDRNGVISENRLSGGTTNRPDLQEQEFCEAIEKVLPEYKPAK